MGKMKAKNSHSLETLRGWGEEVNKQGSGFTSEFFKQLLNFDLGKTTAEPQEFIPAPKPQESGPIALFDAAKIKSQNKAQQVAPSEKAVKPQIKETRTAAIDYAEEILKVGEKAERKNERETMNTIQQLLKELRRLADSSKILQMEFASVSVEQTPTKVGEYHVSFFEWMLIVVRAAREKVEDSGAWLAAVKGKGGKKRWGNKERKKWFANTSLSLGNESGGGVINQTG